MDPKAAWCKTVDLIYLPEDWCDLTNMAMDP